ncbi:TPA: relaxase/mobilization nuclease domain-containing protein [Pseudomonas aeruginosa]|nr:relaxase/mobilization nuclease domain-containing protein [Pseudomonas aeruginosa]
MIRKKISTQKSKPAVYKTAKYFNRENGCVLFETNIYIPINASKAQMASAISQSIEGDITGNKKGRKQSVRTQHDVVSYHTDDKLTPEQAKSIAKELYEKTHNLSNRKYALGVHIDTDEVHVHIVWAIKDFDGKCYNVGNDYRKIERECESLENKHGLIKPKNRISRDIDKLDKMKDLSPEHKKEIIANKYQDKHLPANERMLDVRGIVSNKQQMKDALKPYLDNAFSPSDFIDQITENGFNVIHNGKSSYSIQFDDQIFKASELNLSYKTLKMKLGEDEEFERTLSRKHHVKKQEEDCFLLSSDTQPDFMSKVNPKSVLRTKFKYEQHNDKVEYFYNTYNSKKSFEYYKDPSKVLFNDTSRQSAKAGLQRLLADSNPPSTFTVSGGNHFKKNIWLEFQLMGLEAKGFTLEGYQPKPADLEELKKIQEQYASMNKKVEPEVPTVAIEAPKPTQPLPTQDEPEPLQSEPEKPMEPGSFETEWQEQVEQEQAFIEGDYSTYTTNQLCDEMEDIISRIDRRYFIGNSSNDIDGHRRWDNTHKDYVEAKLPNERKQYYLRQELYEVFDEIRNRNPSLANDLDSEFKKAMKYKSSFKPVYE